MQLCSAESGILSGHPMALQKISAITQMNMTAEELQKRYRWQCRRGSKEVEIILGDYLEHCFLQDSAEEQALFARLLECQDADLFEWFTLRTTSGDASLDDYIRTLLARLADRHAS